MASSTIERAILVGLDLKSRASRSAGSKMENLTSSEESVEELAVLAEGAGASIVDRVLQSRDAPEAATLLGSGKVEELATQVKAADIDVVIFDRDLTPTQQRNLERELECKVVDRTQLILDIFARRARTREGQLQVELAQLNYLLPRLAGRGIQMSRLGGGIGTRGPGETQLEMDRRKISQRISKIEKSLESVRAGRGIQRRQRQAIPLATVGLVGYTNAGKSTLFNRLTGAGVLADARMFATLDPTVRQFSLPSNRRVLLSDTVGFIRNLPTTLVKAFRATLEEVTEAALLLHVVDASAEQAPEYTRHVMDVVREIGAESTPQILVLNKVDRTPLGESDPEAVRRRVVGSLGADTTVPSAVVVSALTGAGLPDLLRRIDALLPLDLVTTARFRIPHADGAAMHILHEYARIVSERVEDEYAEIVAETPESVKRRLIRFLAPER
ncbi:MAG TPA: GTPase HflX [Bryobacteraceae bacterium]|nr:GTPase HflX [Bryobacteraceae bacterium]